ncbi:MAG: SHOCT domain-containing protein [Anaerolineae bacterium]
MLGCGCLLALGAAFAPRVVLIIMWIVGPRINAAFNSFIWPLLGILFAPYTTIMYVLVWSPGVGVAGWDWLWIGFGVALDVMKWSQVFNNRKQVPGYPSSDQAARTAAGPRVAPVSKEDRAEISEELRKLEELRDQGVISPEEYLAKKRELEG